MAIAFIVLAVAVLLIGPRVYAQWANSNAEPAPTLSATGEVTDGVSSYTGTITVTDGSTAGYQVDEVLQGQDVTVRGSTDQVTGTLDIESGTTLSGDITVHGVTQAATSDAQIAMDDDQVEIVGSIPITFSDFGVTAPDLGFVSVEDTGSIEVDLFLAEGA